jgi:prevent-host-death family protein
MDEAVSAAEANRRFSVLLKDVRQGRSFIVTSHGKPVARIGPVNFPEPAAAGARASLLKRLERQAVVDIGRWTREELYEDDR